MRLNHRGAVVGALGITQMLAWASTYYLPAILAAPMARDLGVGVPTIFASFSFALLISALTGPLAGRAVDRWGGRPVLIASNVIFAMGLAILSQVTSVAGLFTAWALIGVGMGSGLYEAAFSTLVRLYGDNSRAAISGITLIGGFASTVGWPLSTYMGLHISWQGACLGWAGLHLVLGLPLNSLLPSATPTPPESGPASSATAACAPHTANTPAPTTTCMTQSGHTPATGSTTAFAPTSAEAPIRTATAAFTSGLPPAQSPRLISVLLSIIFAAAWFNSTAMAAHLPQLLIASGATLATAVAIGALIGPAQVGARILEFSFLQRFHPLLSARLAATAHPVGAALLLLIGSPAAAAFVIFHGAGNGILTIAIGTLPLVLFGPKGYGARQGMLTVPSRIAQAAAPWVFGLSLEHWSVSALWLSSGLALLALACLLWIHPQAAPR
ncbi:MFS transporter [Pusillimonas sp. TS35]|uniref:MFS transporter n=1 Tax=Paracandidimonas lactea TaxID=2895524 RepID=UPI00136D22D4|nr:MFS transporter [Paracandidimonas lactea]MYN12564.1 MFS transporter [Pusillimonas sp. TS35]